MSISLSEYYKINNRLGMLEAVTHNQDIKIKELESTVKELELKVESLEMKTFNPGSYDD